MVYMLQAAVAAPAPGPAADLNTQAENLRAQAEALRAQAAAMRDVARAQREAQGIRREILIPPRGVDSLARRREGMAFMGFVIVVIAAVAILRPLFRALGRRWEQAPARHELASSASDERLERIERAIEAMAIEVERISEGQRFTTKLLAERKPEVLPFER